VHETEMLAHIWVPFDIKIVAKRLDATFAVETAPLYINTPKRSQRTLGLNHPVCGRLSPPQHATKIQAKKSRLLAQCHKCGCLQEDAMY